ETPSTMRQSLRTPLYPHPQLTRFEEQRTLFRNTATGHLRRQPSQSEPYCYGSHPPTLLIECEQARSKQEGADPGWHFPRENEVDETCQRLYYGAANLSIFHVLKVLGAQPVWAPC